MKLTIKDKKEEAKRIEKRSLTLIQYFSLFWATLIFFIIKSDSSNLPANKVLNNFIRSMTAEFGLSEFISLATLLMLFILIVQVYVNLVHNSIKSPVNFNNWNQLIREKYYVLHKSAKKGFAASLILIYYLVYLIFYDNKTLINFLGFVQIVLNDLLVLLILILLPLFDFIKYFKKFSLLTIFDKLTEISFFIVGLIYFIPKYFGLFSFKLSGDIANIFLLSLIISLIYLSLRWYYKYKEFISKPIGKFFDNP